MQWQVALQLSAVSTISFWYFFFPRVSQSLSSSLYDEKFDCFRGSEEITFLLPHISGPGVETVSLSLTFFSRPLVAQLLPSDLACAFCLVLDGGGRCSL